MVEVKIPLSAFVTKGFYFDNGDEGDQVTVSPPTYNKSKVAEGYDKLLVGKLELDEQSLNFYQLKPDSPIMLRELKVTVKGFTLTFADLHFRNHNDTRMQKALVKALAQKFEQSKN